MKYSIAVNKNNILLALFAICTFIYSNNLKAQNHGTGAVFLSASDYAALPEFNWDTLRKYSPKYNGSSIVTNGVTNGITMLINPPVDNQGSEQSCVGWAVGYTALGILTYPKYNCWDIARRSTNYIYNQIKISGNPLYYPCGTGSVTTSALDLVKNQGDCSWNLMPYIDGDCNTSPNTAQRNEAAQNQALNWSKLNANDVTGIKQALDLGYPQNV
jgi:hypothetical protein